MNARIPDIRFYSLGYNDKEQFRVNLEHVENHFISSNWTVCYNDVGSFEAHFDLQSDTLPVVMDNDYLVVVQGNLSAIIVGKKLGDDLTIYGRTCNWLLTKRTTAAFSKSGMADSLVNNIVTDAFPQNDLPSLVDIGNAIGAPLITPERKDRCETFKVVQELLAEKNLGHEMRFDFTASRFVFQVLNGNENNPLVISTVNRNAYDIAMDSDSLAFCNNGWYQEKQTDGSTIWKQAANTNIPARHRSGIFRWDSLLSGNSGSEAIAALNSLSRTDRVQGKTVGVRFETDYALGNTVYVEWQSGAYKRRIPKRIIGVNLWYESGNIGEEPVFEDVE